MSLGRLVVTAVKVEGRTKSEVARDYRTSRGWVHELIRRYEAEGEAGLEPRSRRPRSSPERTPTGIEDEIVELRKALQEEGLDTGPHTNGEGVNQGDPPLVAPSRKCLKHTPGQDFCFARLRTCSSPLSNRS